MKKILELLGLVIFLAVIALIVVLVFNPGNSRDRLIENAINSYLSGQIEGYEIIPAEDRVPYEASDYNHPLIPDEQEEILHNMGVDINSLPSEITPEMEVCFVEKLGEVRAMEIAGGSTPSAVDFFKAKDCLNK